MAKLRGKAKEDFLRRMARGRKKAARSNPKRKAAKKTRAKKTTKKNARKKLTGKAKAEFLRRMARGRNKAKRQNPKKKKNAAHAKKQKFFRPGKSTKKKHRNPDTLTDAERKFEEFHGKPSSRVLEYDQAWHYPENFAEMGKLQELRFDLDEDNEDFPLSNFGNCQAVCTPDGANIYFLGGDQAIDFEALDISSNKDFVELGACTYIRYHTVKGFHDFEPISYHHRFGEEDGIYPVLGYDRLNKTLFLLGGNYTVKPEGIVN